MNRLQGALLEEAFRLVEAGYASAEDVDIACAKGSRCAGPFMGPFEDDRPQCAGGVRDYVVCRLISRSTPCIFPTVQWRRRLDGPGARQESRPAARFIAAERLGERQAWRDRRLMALAGRINGAPSATIRALKFP